MAEPQFTLECRGLSCGYKGQNVLTGIDFHCRAGEVIALLGPNGSGKTTLIRAMTGMIPARQGSTLVCGERLADMNERRIAKFIATVPQEETHRFAFTVREVVGMGRLARSESFFDSPEDAAATTEAMTRAECAELADQYMTEPSGGKQQRALIARALAQDTPGLLLDEPTSHLDVGHQISAARLFRTLGEQGKAIIAAVHDLNLVTTVASRAVLLSDGKVAADMQAEHMMTSSILDEVYGVRFERFRGSDGKVRVYPVL